jgi:hypothetical protein
MTDDEIRRRVALGTPTSPAKLVVLYNDGKTALVKRPGGKQRAGIGRAWYSPRVDRFDLAGPRVELAWKGETVHDSGADRDGPLGPAELIALVLRLGLDPQFIRVPRLCLYLEGGTGTGFVIKDGAGKFYGLGLARKLWERGAVFDCNLAFRRLAESGWDYEAVRRQWQEMDRQRGART